MVFVIFNWIKKNEQLRIGDTAEWVTYMVTLLFLLVLGMDFSPHLHKMGLIFGAIFVSLGQKMTMYRAYLILGLNPDFEYEIKLQSFRSIISLLLLTWAILFSLRSIWILCTLHLLVYLLLALLYYFGLSRLQLPASTNSRGFLGLLRRSMPYDIESGPGDQEVYKH